jgi:hypothetical protein
LPYTSILDVLVTSMSNSDDFNSVYLTLAKATIASCAISLAAYFLYLISHQQYYYSYFIFTPFPMPPTPMHQDYLLPILSKTNWTPLLNNGDGIGTILQHFHQHGWGHLPSTINISTADRITSLPIDLCCSFFRRYPKGLQIGTLDWLPWHRHLPEQHSYIGTSAGHQLTYWRSP